MARHLGGPCSFFARAKRLTGPPILILFYHMVKQLPDLDDAFRALADPTRRAIVDRLAEGPCPVGTLAEPFDMTLGAVSKHLRVLERAGLLEQQRAGNSRICHLKPEPLGRATAWLEHYRRFWEAKLDSLAAHLEDQKGTCDDSH